MKIFKHLLLTITLLTTFFSLGATNVVTDASDTGAGSLRQTIANSIPGDTITFASTLSGSTILLTNGALILDKNLTIDAAELINGLIIDGNQNDRVFYVVGGNTNVLTGLTITNGSSTSNGGGIQNFGNLTLNRCSIIGNAANQGFGGGIESQYILTLNQCTVAKNTAFLGGAIANGCCNLLVNQSTISGNTATYEQGGIINDSSLAISNSITTGNTGNYTEPFTGANNLTTGDPVLAPLGYYGGSTPTMPPLPGSPAIDAGAATSFTSDQRGFLRTIDGNGDTVAVPDIGSVEGIFNPAGPGVLTGVGHLGDGSFRLGFTNYSGMPYAVLASTNMALPLNVWSNLGTAVETPPGSGQYQFTDPQATSYAQRFYQVRSP